MSEPLIDSRLVSETFDICFINDDQLVEIEANPTNCKQCESVMGPRHMRIDKLEENRERIVSWLSALDDAYRRSVGGGYTFLNMCVDRDGQQWTGFHMVQNQLVMLGNGIGMCSILYIKDFIRNAMPDLSDTELDEFVEQQGLALPGGMPYIVVEL